MFTGLIEEVGHIRGIRATGRSTQLQVAAPGISNDLRLGESVAVNGCCLTATAIRNGEITFDLLEETVARTNFGNLGRKAL
jgi:riboflavin synthase